MLDHFAFIGVYHEPSKLGFWCWRIYSSQHQAVLHQGQLH